MSNHKHRHLVTRGIELLPTRHQVEQLEEVFGGVRNFHNAVVRNMSALPTARIKADLIQSLLSEQERELSSTLSSAEFYRQQRQAEKCLAFKKCFVMESELSDMAVEQLSKVSKAILLSHSSLIAESWVEYLDEDRHRPTERERTYIQSFWMSDVNQIFVKDSSIIIPTTREGVVFDFEKVDTYGLYQPTMYRLTKNLERYFLTILYEKPMDYSYQQDDSSYPSFLEARGCSLSHLLNQLHSGVSEKEKEILQENILMVRRFVLNRIQQRRCSYKFSR